MQGLLDHDLQEQVAIESDRYLCGNDVVDIILQDISYNVPILVHSVNISRAPVMVSRLEKAGFWVTRIPMDELTEEDLAEWLQEVRDIWETFQDE